MASPSISTNFKNMNCTQMCLVALAVSNLGLLMLSFLQIQILNLISYKILLLSIITLIRMNVLGQCQEEYLLKYIII
jgi:hypothetical protein